MIFFSSTSYLPAHMTSCHRLTITTSQDRNPGCGRCCLIPPHRFWGPPSVDRFFTNVCKAPLLLSEAGLPPARKQATPQPGLLLRAACQRAQPLLFFFFACASKKKTKSTFAPCTRFLATPPIRCPSAGGPQLLHNGPKGCFFTLQESLLFCVCSGGFAAGADTSHEP